MFSKSLMNSYYPVFLLFLMQYTAYRNEGYRFISISFRRISLLTVEVFKSLSGTNGGISYVSISKEKIEYDASAQSGKESGKDNEIKMDMDTFRQV